jgi:CheY-like chemotaxis protein
MEQVLMNFAVNARDAMSGQGVLSISTDVTVLRATDPGAPLTRPEGHFVLLTVADTGCGMSAETLAHIFEPFYTTKGLGRGTGLGLSTVYGIVKQHEGWIEVESAPGKGSIFRVYIPLAKDPDSAAADPRKSGTHDVVSLTPEEKILVVEDEAEVLEYIVTALETSGYPVEYARSGAEAVRKWKDPASARLLITDMVMPEGLSGSALAQQMAARKPGLRVIYCSGYSPEVVAHGALLNEGVNFLAKPFTRDELLSAVFRALTDHRPCQLLPAHAPAEAREVAEAHAI